MTNYEHFKTCSLEQLAVILAIVHDFDRCTNNSDFNDWVEFLQDEYSVEFWKSYCKYYGVPMCIFD